MSFGVLVDPPIVDQPDRNRVEEVELLPTCFAGDHEARVFEHAQMLHDAEPGHLHLGLELGERAAVTLEEPVEEMAARRIGECLEHGIVVHAPNDT